MSVKIGGPTLDDALSISQQKHGMSNPRQRITR